ncbi:MAG: hypothetical protein V1793_01490 [Pseudomonadota bacterium]
MLDIAVSYNKYKFLGNEFLTWIWFVIETNASISGLLNIKDKTITMKIGNSIVLENSLGDQSVEKISIKGDDAGLEEGTTALRKGALVTDMNLHLSVDDSEFRFSLKGESMNITGLKTPPAGAVEQEDELEGAVLEKTYLCSSLFDMIDALFAVFIKKRISPDWKNKDLQEIKNWIKL